MMLRRFLYLTLVLPLLFVIGQAASPPTIAAVWNNPPHLRICVSSAISGATLANTSVSLTVNGTSHTASTDAQGIAEFTGLTFQANVPAVLDDDGNELIPERMKILVDVAVTGFLPLRKEFLLYQNDLRREMRLVSRETGFTTPAIEAATGGKFVLPKLGTLRVEPGTLPQNCHLRLIPIPFESTSPYLVSGSLRQQIWLEAVDSAGQSLPLGQPTTPGGISLTLELPFSESIPENDNGSWQTHHYDASFAQVGATEGTYDETTLKATMTLAAGNNLLERTYATPTAEGSAGPWELLTTHISTQVQTAASSGILCGLYLNSITASVKKGEEVETSAEISTELLGEVGWDAGALFSKASAKIGGKVKKGTTETTAISIMIEGKASSPSTGTINGASQPLSPPYSCISGNATAGLVLKTYRLLARRRKVLPSGFITRDTIVLGTLQIASDVRIWFSDLVWDSTCPGCPATGTIPSFPQDPSQGN